jgi:hypothetical protein
MDTPLLERIQKLQFTDRAAAESLLLDFVSELFPQLGVTAVELRPQAISLNSFNGFLTLTGGEKLFFKTHVEQDNIIDEYYNAQTLASAGYPVIQPLYSSTRSGQQLLIYEIVTDPSVFDVARALETDSPDDAVYKSLQIAQNKADDDLLLCFQQTLDSKSAQDAARPPIHQLFYHRLTGGRLERFYGADTQIDLPHGTFDLAQVRQVQWEINGARYQVTLDDLIEKATALLNPAVQNGLTIIGHGDAHNGNVFFDRASQRLIYFDPAFAGRHPPLLDLAKPLFHNVFAMWMYFPEQEREKLDIKVKVVNGVWQVEHDYAINPLRQMFLESKVERVLIPILQTLRQNNVLPQGWRAYLKSALFCCPFLTLDLKRFPPEISLLGLTMAVQMGAESQGEPSLVDTMLDRVAAALA